MGEPVRVAQIMGYMNGGGVEQVVMNYYRHIDRSRVQFDLIVCEGSAMVPLDEVESLGGRVFMVPAYSRVLAFQRSLLDLFRQERWPVVHSHMNALSVFPLRAAKRAGVPVRIAHSHSTAGRGELAKNALKYALRPLANAYPTRRMACSRHAGEWLFGKGVDFDVVPNAIELDRFAFDPEARAELRAELDVSGDQLLVGHIGRFMPQKNQGFLLEVFAEVLRRDPSAVLAMAGEGPQLAEMEERAVALGVSGSVRFLGQRADAARLYSAFDVFCLPSLYEGLGMVAVEAQVAGLPCLLSEAVPQEADVTGACRFLSLDSLTVWINEIMTASRTNPICRQMDRTPFANFDIDIATRRLMNAYEQLAGIRCGWTEDSRVYF